MEKKYRLVKWSDNWADEMYLQGFVILTEDECNKWKDVLSKLSGFTLCFGTNEYNDYESGQEILDNCKIFELSSEEAATIRKYVGDRYGHTDFYDTDWEEYLDDSEEECESDTSEQTKEISEFPYQNSF